MSETAPPVSTRDLLNIRDFRLLWLGQVVSNFGDALTHLTLVLFINRITDGSTQAIAWLLIALALPTATLGLVAGVFVDRWRRRRVMIVSDLLRAALTLGFLVAAATEQLVLIYVLAFLHASVGSFFAPARSALIPRVVPKEGLLAANSLSQMSAVFFRVLGVSVAGFLVGTLHTFQVAFVVDALTFIVSAALVSRLGLPPRELVEAARASAGVILSELRTGVSIIANTRILIAIMVTLAVTMLGIGAINVLLAPMLVNELKLPETWFGAVEFAQTVGMIIGGALTATLAAKLVPTRIVSNSLIIVGIAITFLYGVTEIWHLFPILFGIGLVMTPLNASIATIMQSAVANELLGRVSGALHAVIQTTSLISMFFAGAFAAMIGVRNVFIVSGAITVVAGLAAVFMFRGHEATPAATELAAAVQPAAEGLD